MHVWPELHLSFPVWRESEVESSVGCAEGSSGIECLRWLKLESIERRLLWVGGFKGPVSLDPKLGE